jgi:hypothetical protein
MNCGLQRDGNPIHAHCPECQHEQIEVLKKRIAELEAECLEQARLNGMGSEREARLMGRIAELEALIYSRWGGE